MHVCVHVCMQWWEFAARRAEGVGVDRTCAHCSKCKAGLSAGWLSNIADAAACAMQIRLQRCHCNREELRDVIFRDNHSLVPAVDMLQRIFSILSHSRGNWAYHAGGIQW